MNTNFRVKTADKVKAAIEKGWKKKAIAEQIGISRPTFDSRLKDNCWQFSEINALKQLGIL
jgi:DNA-binding Xre family transcriptional regulator